MQCRHDVDFFCPGSGNEEVASVVCIEKQADLVPDLCTLMATVYLEDKHLFFLQVSKLALFKHVFKAWSPFCFRSYSVVEYFAVCHGGELFGPGGLSAEEGES